MVLLTSLAFPIMQPTSSEHQKAYLSILSAFLSAFLLTDLLLQFIDV